MSSNVMAGIRTFGRRFAITIVLPCLLLLIWHISPEIIRNQVILPSVNQVTAILASPTVSLIGMGSLVRNILISLVRVLLGYLVGAMLAIPLGVLMGYNRLAFRLCNTFLNLFRPIPPLAWVPLVMAWFGVASLATWLGLDRGTLYIYLNSLTDRLLGLLEEEVFDKKSGDKNA